MSPETKSPASAGASRPAARPTPYTILIDSAEQTPFAFAGLFDDPAARSRPLKVSTVRVCLGRHPNSLGDYSISSPEQRRKASGRPALPAINGVGRCHVERKSVADLQCTLLGFGDGHRDRFLAELGNLNAIEAAAVIVEGTLPDVLAAAPEWGQRSAAANAVALQRSVLACQQDFPRVQWVFAGSRRLAEMACFGWLSRWWRKQAEAARRALSRETIAVGTAAGEGFDSGFDDLL